MPKKEEEMILVSEEVKALCSSILTDKKWEMKSNYTFGNDNSLIWIGNGILFVDFYPEVRAFNFFEKILVLKAIKKRIILDVIKDSQ